METFHVYEYNLHGVPNLGWANTLFSTLIDPAYSQNPADHTITNVLDCFHDPSLSYMYLLLHVLFVHVTEMKILQSE